MENVWWIWILVLVVFFYLFSSKKKKRKLAIHQILHKKKLQKENTHMKELAQRFLTKDCYINLVEGTVDGVIREVTDGGLVIEKDSGIQIVNLDYVVRIREYPYDKKKNKRASFIAG